MAIGSLVCAVGGLGTFVGLIPGLILGIIGITKTGKSGRRGRGFAVAGTAISSVALVGYAVILFFVIQSLDYRDDSGHIDRNADIPASDLRVGDCLASLPAGSDAQTFLGVPCGQPHRAEVYGVVDVPSDITYADMDKWAEDRCVALLKTYSPAAWVDPDVGLVYLLPTEVGWRSGDHRIICVAEHPERTGSIRS